MTADVTEIKISAKKIKSILRDAEKTAKAVNLVYVQDTHPGISRVKKGDAFVYVSGTRQLRDKATLERIRKLVIPPAWEDVWICKLDNGHLQVTGVDVKKRKQYKYHSHWNALRNQTKFYCLHDFGKSLPGIRKKLRQDLSLPGMPAEKVLATVVALMEQTSIRIGNSAYEKLYGSFGLTTLKNRHVKITSDQIQFQFVGKKGIAHKIGIKNKRLAKIVKQCRDIPGKELFQYYDAEGNHKSVDSGMVNAYLKEITGEAFTAKDFRTWAGTVQALVEFKQARVGKTQAEIKTNIITVIDRVAQHLGNTRTVCKKYYVHPAIIALYENATLNPYLEKLGGELEANNNDLIEGLSSEEKLLMHILEKENLVCN